MSNYYTGVGSRQTPTDILEIMSVLGYYFASHNLKLRSGGAIGADFSFEKGCDSYWEDDSSLYKQIFKANQDIPLWANVFTEYFHPVPSKLGDYPRLLMNRNACQVLGKDGNTPSLFLVCWTPDGKDSGGTGQAIRIAKFFDIQVFNLKIDSHRYYMLDCLDRNVLPI